METPIRSYSGAQLTVIFIKMNQNSFGKLYISILEYQLFRSSKLSHYNGRITMQQLYIFTDPNRSFIKFQLAFINVFPTGDHHDQCQQAKGFIHATNLPI